MNPVIEITNLSRNFGRKVALADVSIAVEKGTVMGIVGENGSGKTTILKHILGLLKPSTGTVSVFGFDPVADPVSVLSQIGYLSEEDSLPGWMRIHELQRYMRGFYPTWDQEYADNLVREFHLDRSARILSLSKGQRARAGLMAALAYRPNLLLLDEPSSGLDPIVRRDILGAIVRTIAEEGRTVVLSSHLLGEVDRVADNVTMIKQGRVAFSESLDSIKESHLHLSLVLQAPSATPPRFPGAIGIEGGGTEWSVVFKGDFAYAQRSASALGATIADHKWANFDEIFVAYSRPITDPSLNLEVGP